MTLIPIASILAVAFLTLVILVRRSWTAAQPDEWLLRVRNGRVVDAGIGISLWRRPGDVIARFSSTVQRVRFTVGALTKEHLEVTVDGFILWAVAPDVERAFRAFSKLGIANLDRPTPALKSRAHLLTSPQHHAFQALLAAEVRAHVGSLSLDEVLTVEGSLVRGLEERLQSLSESLGIAIERTEILQAQPADRELLRDLSARSEERVREEAANARLEARARLRSRQAEEAKRAAAEEADGKLAAEAAEMTLFEARKAREEEELAQALDRERRTAEAARDAAITRQAAEEHKSRELRDHELTKFVAEQTARAMAGWEIREGKWIHLGEDSPGTAVAKVVVGMRALLEQGKKN